MSVLTREEEELFFSLNLVIGREPQSIKSIEVGRQILNLFVETELSVQ